MPFTVLKDFGQNRAVCITVGKTVTSAISEYDMHTKIDTNTNIPEKTPLFFFFFVAL